MKCENCEYCQFVHFDGYICTKFNSYLPEKLIDKDIDCKVRDYDFESKVIFVDEDGCKNVKGIFLEMINFLQEE